MTPSAWQFVPRTTAETIYKTTIYYNQFNDYSIANLRVYCQWQTRTGVDVRVSVKIIKIINALPSLEEFKCAH